MSERNAQTVPEYDPLSQLKRKVTSNLAHSAAPLRPITGKIVFNSRQVGPALCRCIQFVFQFVFRVMIDPSSPVRKAWNSTG
jgi:hypothetical protein